MNQFLILALCLVGAWAAPEASAPDWSELATLGMRGLLFSCSLEGKFCNNNLDCGIGCSCYEDECTDRDDIDDDDSNNDDNGGFNFGNSGSSGSSGGSSGSGGSGISGNLIPSLIGILGSFFS